MAEYESAAIPALRDCQEYITQVRDRHRRYPLSEKELDNLLSWFIEGVENDIADAVVQRDVAREQVHSINLALIAISKRLADTERRAIRAESDLADARQYAGGRTWDPEH